MPIIANVLFSALHPCPQQTSTVVATKTIGLLHGHRGIINQ